MIRFIIFFIILLAGCSNTREQQWFEESERIRDISLNCMERKFEMSNLEYQFLVEHGVNPPQAEYLMRHWDEKQWIDRRNEIIRILSLTD